MNTALQSTIFGWGAVSSLELGIPLAVVVIGAVAFVKWSQQRRADVMRRTYEVSFPRAMTHEHVLNFLRSLAGLAKPTMFKPVYAVSLELYADEFGVKYYLSIPGHVHTAVDNWLTTHIDGASLTLVRAIDDKVANTVWERGLSLRMTGTDTPLDIPSAKAMSNGVRSGFNTVGANEAAVLQWIVFPAPHQSPHTPERTSWLLAALGGRPSPNPGHKAKVSDKTFNAITRIAASGEDARRLVRDIYAGLSVAHTYGVSFREHHHHNVTKLINERRGVLAYPVFVNALELSALLGWQMDSASGQVKARHLQPSAAIPTEGISLGISNYPKARGRTLAVPLAAIPYHVWVTGPTGSGKSVALENIAVQLMQQGAGLIVIEPKGELAHSILMGVPKARAQDVIWFDPTDTAFPIGLNVLSGPDPERTTGHIVGMFQSLYGDSWGSRLERILRYSVLTASLNGLTLYDVKQLLINPDFRGRIVRATKHSEARQFWRWLDAASDTYVDSVVNKLDSFLGSSAIRNIIGQTDGLDMDKVVRERKILLVPLASARLGQANAAGLGSLIYEMVWDAALRRPTGGRDPVALVMDEFQNYADLSTSKSDAFAEARSYGLGLVIANQHTDQLPNKVLSSVKQNTRTKIVFGTGPDDAKKLASNFSPLSADDLQYPEQYHFAASLMTEQGQVTVTGKAAPPPMPTGSGSVALAHSRSLYGKPRSAVEADMRERHKADESDRKRPTIGRRNQ